MSFWGSVVDASISLGGAYLSSKAAGDAAQITANAANDSAAVQREMFNQTRQDQAPYRDIGQNSLYDLASLYGIEYEGAPGTIEDRAATAMARFKQSPGYQWRVDEGTKALDRSAASRGRLRSGAQDQAVVDYGQNAATAEYGDYTNRISSLAGVGQTATQSLAAARANTAANISNATMTAGNAAATGVANKNNALQTGIENFMKAW